MDVSEIHWTRNKICSYVLKLEGDASREAYYWVGYSCDLEKRILQHLGKAPGGAKFTALHKPVEILQVRIHETTAEAMAMETALWNFYAAKLNDYDAVRGGRYNCTTDLRYPPRGWNPVQENQTQE